MDIDYRSVTLSGMKVSSIYEQATLMLSSMIKSAAISQKMLDPMDVEKLLDIQNSTRAGKVAKLSVALVQQASFF